MQCESKRCLVLKKKYTKQQHKNALCTWAKMYKYIRKIFKNNMNKYMNSSWKTFLCCYGESGKRITQVYKYHIQTRLQYKTVIHNYIKIVNFKFIFNNFILLFQLADFYGCLIHSLFNAAPYEMFYLTWIIAQPPKQLCERKLNTNEWTCNEVKFIPINRCVHSAGWNNGTSGRQRPRQGSVTGKDWRARKT